MEILISEDDYISRRLLELAFAAYRWSCTAVCEYQVVEYVLRAFKANKPYQLVCIFSSIPYGNALQIIREVRTIEEMILDGKEKVKILVISSLDDPRTIMSCFKEGCDDYLITPIDRFKIAKSMIKLNLL